MAMEIARCALVHYFCGLMFQIIHVMTKLRVCEIYVMICQVKLDLTRAGC